LRGANSLKDIVNCIEKIQNKYFSTFIIDKAEAINSTMKFNNETLRAAVKEWLDDESKAEKKYGHISDWDTSEVTDMSNMFDGAKSFNQPLEKWDVSKVTNMSQMFLGATSFNQPLEKWDVSQVTTQCQMFLGAFSFNQPLEKWDVSNVTNMYQMFAFTFSFNQPLEKWDVSKVTNREDMFDGATSFTHQVPKWKLNTPNNLGEESLTQQGPLSQKALFIKNLDKKTTLERFAKDWHLNEEEVEEIMEELEDSGYWDNEIFEMEMKDNHIEVSIWPDEVETYGYVTELYPDEFLLLYYHIEQRGEDEYTVLSVDNQGEWLSIVFEGGEYDKKSRLNEDELAVFNQSEDTGAGDNGKYNYQLFIKKEDFIETGWNGVIKTIGLDVE
jgi:surface protein